MMSHVNSDKDPAGACGHNVFCFWPHSLQVYSTRPWPGSAVTRFGAPHLLHFTSNRVLPRVIVTFRAIASLIKRSDSWRMASFDIAGARGFRTINSPCAKKPCLVPRTRSSHNNCCEFDCELRVQSGTRIIELLVWRFRSPHHSCSESEMRTSEPKPH